MIDVNTVIGEPIATPDDVTIIPVTKVSIGYGGGAAATSQRRIIRQNRDNAFGGGSRRGQSTITPVAFLVVRGESVRMLPVAEPASARPWTGSSSSCRSLLDKVSEHLLKEQKRLAKEEPDIE